MAEYQLTYVVTTWIILAALLISTVFWWSRRPKNLPPSPGMCLPIIGHLYLLDAKNSRKQFKEWGETIGRIFSLQMGASTYVVLNDFQLIKNLTIKHADTMTGRSTVNLLSRHVPSRFRGLIVSSGPLWREQRATAMTILRNLGMGKSVLAEKISQEVSVYVRELSLLKGEPSNIKALTNMSVSNVICSVIFGRRFEFDDPFFLKTVGQFNVLVELAATVSLANFLPLLVYLPFDIFGGRRLIKTYREVQKCNEYMVEKVRTELDPESGDNFIFSYIREMEKQVI